MSAAPASGTARKRHSSQNPACSDSASGLSHGSTVASESGFSSASEGDHQPRYPMVSQ